LPPYGQVEVGLQDFLLAVAGFQLQRARHLFDLAARRTRVELPAQARQLHGEGRATNARLAAAVGGPRTAQQADRIDARMPAKPRVLVQQHRIDQFRRHLADGRPQPITLVRCQAQP
jgi:hypothetical protein